MISLYSGTPGAGKSLHLASRLLNWMRYKNAPIILAASKIRKEVICT